MSFCNVNGEKMIKSRVDDKVSNFMETYGLKSIIFNHVQKNKKIWV